MPKINSQEIEQLVFNGSIGAISLDSNIFDGLSIRLSGGLLKQLEQFHATADFSFILPEIVAREVHSHLTKLIDQSRSAIKKSLADAVAYLNLEENQRNIIIQQCVSSATPADEAKKLLQDYFKKCGAILLKTKDTVDIDELQNLYFKGEEPFEDAKGKKNEFPDALALLAMKWWAIDKGRGILLVTKDKGCIAYCEKSQHFFVLEKLDDALEIIQKRDAHRVNLTNKFAADLAKGDYGDFNQMIYDAIERSIDLIDWEPEADSYCSFDAEVSDVTIRGVTLPAGGLKLKPLSYFSNQLTASGSVMLEVEVACYFSYAVRDGIDRDMVPVGSSSESKIITVPVDFLVDVSDPEGENPEFMDIDVQGTTYHIDYGSVSPDYSDERDEDERY